MVKKVFRIHNEGKPDNDWFPSVPITKDLIISIHSDSGDGKKLPTSIPSPFARIDLVRTAFQAVGESGKLDGLERNGVATATDNHKLISDALDIGQILFNYDKYKDDLQLVAWDKTTSLQILIDGNDKQRHLGKTLELFLKQDSSQYNFDKFDKIYILKYKHKVIGGTSPRTLFFAAPDAEKTNIKFGNDIMLDEHLLPLYRRDEEYIKYLYSLSKTVDNFDAKFPEFNGYLKKTMDELSNYKPQLWSDLQDMVYKSYLKELKNVVLDNNAGLPIEIIQGVPLKQYIKSPKIIENQSDFVIKASKEVKGNKPLVLPVEKISLRYIYTEDIWNSDTIVPAEDTRSLSERKLPDQGDKYPYLTMNDFLSDTIIELPYEINSNKFLTIGSKKFLIPLKKEFFKYFSVEDIKDKSLIKIENLAGGAVEVELSIPIKRGYITYKKIYFKRTTANENNDAKKGTIIEKPFALSVFPFVANVEESITYYIGTADTTPIKNEKLEVGFFKTSDSYENLKIKHSAQRAGEPIITHQTIIEDHFDAIGLKVGNVENFIIPKWIEYKGNSGDIYEFAIDFGTTNTHIEYKIHGEGSPGAYNITEGQEQIVFLMPSDTPRRSKTIRDIVDGEDHLIQEVISERFGEGELRNAPFRTCLIQNTDINYDKATKIFTDANIGFDYEKKVLRKYLKPFTDLKWSSDNTDNNKRMEHYIEELLVLCKNKVLMNNGNLSKTRITWFYPVSMTQHHLRRLQKIWEDKSGAVFGTDKVDLFDYPESVAPFYYYKGKEGIKTKAKPSVSVDIGGGTTDVMIFADETPQLITSFRFAGNSIFGDGFNGNIRNNGFALKYYQKIKNILTLNDLNTEIEILDRIYNDYESSPDLVNFFFSLKENQNIKDKELDIDFSEMLADDDDFKILFLLFYSSIIYHIAEMMKIKEMEPPRNILFSGTGSKTLLILDSDKKLPDLNKLFGEIFNKVYNTTDSKIETKTDPNPKELTCKGGFYIENLDITKHKELVEVSLGSINSKNIRSKVKNNDTITYADVDREFIKEVVENVEEFYKLFMFLNKSTDFKDVFGMSQTSLNIFDKIKSDDMEDYILEGMDRAKGNSSDEEPLSETLFFYTLIGKLNELAIEIIENE